MGVFLGRAFSPWTGGWNWFPRASALDWDGVTPLARKRENIWHLLSRRGLIAAPCTALGGYNMEQIKSTPQNLTNTANHSMPYLILHPHQLMGLFHGKNRNYLQMLGRIILDEKPELSHSIID